jgi:hypothetical protein
MFPMRDRKYRPRNGRSDLAELAKVQANSVSLRPTLALESQLELADPAMLPLAQQPVVAVWHRMEALPTVGSAHIEKVQLTASAIALYLDFSFVSRIDD